MVCLFQTPFTLSEPFHEQPHEQPPFPAPASRFPKPPIPAPPLAVEATEVVETKPVPVEEPPRPPQPALAPKMQAPSPKAAPKEAATAAPQVSVKPKSVVVVVQPPPVQPVPAAEAAPQEVAVAEREDTSAPPVAREHSQRGAAGPGGRGRGRPAGRVDMTNDFDFQMGQVQFERLRLEDASGGPQMKAFRQFDVTLTLQPYDRNDFFDNLSCDALDKADPVHKYSSLPSGSNAQGLKSRGDPTLRRLVSADAVAGGVVGATGAVGAGATRGGEATGMATRDAGGGLLSNNVTVDCV